MTEAERFHAAARIFENCRSRSPHERRRVLDQMCDGDHRLRREVEQLLAAHDRDGDPLKTGAGDAVSKSVARDPERIGRYRILERIGAGGMGVVYRAAQQSPEREVALKVLPAWMVSDAARARFEHESQALGRLDHPGIARIYEADVDRDVDGVERPYFAMELVRGDSLKRAAATMPVTDRLEMIAAICDAVQHAHQRGVIHRDLKPSNIIIDQEGRPRILDFGIARITGVDEQNTLTGQVIGTVQYMSPEQAAGDPEAIDTRTDVYALGVILYETLTGRPPYDVSDMSMLTALRTIADAPPAPLVNLDTPHQSDLTTIVNKALAKDPHQRYQSAAELGEDLRRSLRNEPIRAHPPSTAYLVRKFVSRHRPLVALGSAAVLALIVGAIALAVGLSRARDAEALALTRLDRAREAEALALQRLEDVQREARKSEAVRDFLRGMLASVDPSQTADRELTVRAALDAATMELEGDALRDQPAVRGAVLGTIGNTYRGLGLPDIAESSLEEAVKLLEQSGDDVELGLTLGTLAGVHLDRQQYDLAEPIYRRAISIWEAHPEQAGRIPVSMDGLGLALQGLGETQQSLKIFREALPLHEKHSGRPSLEYATCLNNIATAHYYLDDYEQAAEGFEAVLEMQRQLVEESHPDILRTLSNLAATYQSLGRTDDALAMGERAIDLRRQRLGPDHPDLLYPLISYGRALHDAGRFESAIEQYDEAWRVAETAYGDNHQNGAIAWHNRGRSLRSLHRYEEAWTSFRRAFEIRDSNGLYRYAAESLDDAAYIRQLQSDYDAAQRELEEVAAYIEENLPDNAELAATNIFSQGLLHTRRKQYALAAEKIARAVEMRRNVFGDSHGRVGEALCRLGYALVHLERWEDAESALRESETIMIPVVGEGHFLVAEARGSLGACLLQRGDAESAIPLLEDAYEVLKSGVAVSPPRLAELAGLLARAYEMLGDAESATAWTDRRDTHLAQSEKS